LLRNNRELIFSGRFGEKGVFGLVLLEGWKMRALAYLKMSKAGIVGIIGLPFRLKERGKRH